MSWKNTLRKQEINMDIGSTNYAKDNGDSVTFDNKVTVPKSQLVELVSRYDSSIERMTQITMSSGMTDKFVMWLEKNMDTMKKAPFGGSKVSEEKRLFIVQAAEEELDSLVESYKGENPIKLGGFSVENFLNKVEREYSGRRIIVEYIPIVLKEKYGAKSVVFNDKASFKTIVLNF